MKKARIALKPYLDTIQGYCSSLTKAELTGIIMRLAQDVSTAGRVAFLEKIESCLPAFQLPPAPKIGAVEQILSDIEALGESIAERIASIEDGSFWDNQDTSEDWYDDEDPDYVSDEQFAELTSFFDAAGAMFLQDRLEEARKVYDALFGLIGTVAERADVFWGSVVDIREERARFCRCVYETADGAERLDAFAAAMEIDATDSLNPHEFDEKYPLLQDVMDARRGDMPDLGEFLVAWKEMLARQGLDTRPAVLLLETVYRLEGFAGVSRLARKWKNRQPQGYLFWLERLQEGNDLKSVIEVSAEGLKALKKGAAREQVAQFLIDAAQEQGDAHHLLLGKRERFFSRPSEQNLAALVGEAVKQDVRNRELGRVIRFFGSAKSDDFDKTALYIKALLMAGKLADAFALVAREKCVGWSYASSAGVVFGAVLSVMAHHDERAVTIKAVLSNYANRVSIYSGRVTVEDLPENAISEAILNGLKQAKHTPDQTKKYWSWALRIGKRRIDHIVSNQHRNAYQRAAQVLGCLAEAYMAMGKKNRARKIIHHFYAEKYNRFSAFRREVKSVATASELLADVYF